jgi:sarcosine oxidase / L-pipecolate oxidase
LAREELDMSSRPKYDVVVIGGGPMGLAAAYNCAKAGQSVLVLERFNFFNQSGSSNDLVRMFRTMYTQDFMADLAVQAIELWRDLEREAGQALILMSGLLNFGDPKYQNGPEGNLTAPVKNLDRLKMSYRLLSAREIMAEYPFKKLPSSFQGIFAPDNGCINIPEVLRSLYKLACAYGAKLVPHTQVHGIKVDEDGVTIEVSLGTAKTIRARRCILTAGAYTNHVLASLGLRIHLNIWEMVYEYYATASGPNGIVYPSMWFQFLDPSGNPAQSNLFYGFPSVPWAPANLSRIAVDDATNIIAVDERPNYSGTCLQANVLDNMFVLDLLPPSVGRGHKNVAVFTAGWGFKFVPLIGRVLSDLVLKGKSKYDVSQFAITRQGVLSAPQASVMKTASREFSRIPL